MPPRKRVGGELPWLEDSKEPARQSCVDEVDLRGLDDLLRDVPVVGETRYTSYVASRTDSHAFAVGCETPASDARLERLRSPPIRPAHRRKNRWKVVRSCTLSN